MKKILSILLIALLLPIGVFATDYDTSQINGVENTTVDTTNGGSSTNISVVDPTTPIDPDMTVNNIIDPNITVTDFGNKILSKLYEVASLLQKIAAPVAIVMFIVGAILMVIGALGKRDGMKQGIVVMVLSIITYAVCMYAQPIVIAVSNWLVA